MSESGTYDQATILRRQKLAEQMLAGAQPPTNMRSPWQGLSYLANTGVDAFALNRLDKQAAESRKADTAALMSILNGGGGAQPSAPSAVASPSPSPAMPPPSPSIGDRTRMAESGGDPLAKNPNSSATGPDQFINSTWLDTIKSNRPELAAGKDDATLLAMRSDPELSGQMRDAYATQNRKLLSDRGLPVTPGSTYLAHFAGPEGASKVLSADPKMRVAELLSPGAMQANPMLANMTAGDMRAWADRKMGDGAPAAPAVAQAMSPSAALPPAPGALPTNQPTGIPDPQKAAIARLMSATPGSPAYQLGLQLAGQSLAPKNFTHQTLPNGDILQVDPTGKLPPKVIYQAPVKSELKDTGTDPLTGQKSFSEYNPQAHTLTPMNSGSAAVPSDQTFNAIAAAKERGAPQQELYQHVPISLRNGVQAMIEGKSLPTNLSNRGAARDATLKYAHAIDENFDEMLIPQRKAFATSMGSQQISSFGGQVRSAGTIVKHLGGAAEAFKTLEDSGAINETLPILNRPQLAMKGQSGDKKFNDAMGKWGTAVEGIAGELTQLLTGGVGAEHTKQEWRDKLDIRTQPISKVKATLDQAAQLMLGRLSNVAQAKERAYQTPTDPISLLGPDEQKILQRLKAGTVQPDSRAAPASSVQTATNPQTGERVQLNPKTGQWEPLK